ncbi:nitroreductase family protein [Limisalsivibrio acetivorans]|uniref:nitroreductase family protein n=1 Tax=Limisalsivibrio acetivorans TaxID=1304888 RepID=UPI0003B666D4|nr:nitroreductase family protein [Limisalsivibrio acetivorans]
MELLNAIRERRSINDFDSTKHISDEKLEELLSLAALAPSSFNLQPWEAVVVRTDEKKKALREAAFGQPKVEDASAVIIVVGNADAVEENLEDIIQSMIDNGYVDEESADGPRGMASSFYGEPDSERRRIFAAKNAAFFGMSIMLAAKGLGLDTHPMDGFDEAKVKEIFGIDEKDVVPMLIAVGSLQPGKTLLPRNVRFSPERFARFE